MTSSFRDDAIDEYEIVESCENAAEAKAAAALFEKLFGVRPGSLHVENGTVERNGLIFRRYFKKCAERYEQIPALEMWDRDTLPEHEIWSPVAGFADVGEAILAARAQAESISSCPVARFDPRVHLVIATH